MYCIIYYIILYYISIHLSIYLSIYPSIYLVLCHPLLLLPSIFSSIRVFSKELTLDTRYPKYWILRGEEMIFGEDEWVVRRIDGKHGSLWQFVCVWCGFLVFSPGVCHSSLIDKRPWKGIYDNRVPLGGAVFRQRKGIQRNLSSCLLFLKRLQLKITNLPKRCILGWQILLPFTHFINEQTWLSLT